MKQFLRFLSIGLVVSLYYFTQSIASDTGVVASSQAEVIPGLVVDYQDTNKNHSIALIVRDVYEQAQKNFNSEIVLFSRVLVDNFKLLPDEITLDDIQNYNGMCNDQLEQSIEVINRISNNALHQYYDGLEKAGISYRLGVTDPIARKLTRDINVIEYDVIYDMKTAVEKIQFVDRLDEISQEIKNAKNNYEDAAEKDYAQRQALASQKRKVTIWKELRIARNDFLGRLQDVIADECKAAFINAINENLNLLGQAVMDAAVDNLDQLGKQALENISKSFVFDMNFGTDYIGEQLSAKLQEYTSDQLQEMLAKFPDYLKKEALKTVGMSEDEDTMVASLKAIVRKQYPVKQKFDTLQVRQSTNLAPEELLFVKNRMPKIKEALKNNFEITAPLKMGLCTSGGGNRAMLVTLGFHLGAQDIGLLDSLLYTAGVSGSTWTISAWSYLNATIGMSLTDFKNQLISGPINTSMVTIAGTSIPPLPDKNQQTMMGLNIARHFAYGQTISSIDLYGGLIGNYTLLAAGKDRLNATWSSIGDTIQNGDIPLPMGSAVSYKKGQESKGSSEYYWFEVGPFEVGSDQVGAYVPVWAFGSKFDQGKPVEGYQGRAPEYPISYYQGVFGSAFAASINEVVDQVLVKPEFTMFGEKIIVPVDTWIKTSLPEIYRDSRIYPATFHNYTAAMKGSPLANATDIRLYDGAMNINFPLPILMRPARDLDVIFICDAAVDLESLKSAQLHCQRNGLKFPDISKLTQMSLSANPLTVLNDPRLKDYDKNIVTILYSPFIKNSAYLPDFDPELCMNQGECATFNFKYTSEEANRVVELMRYNINQIQPQIKEVLQALQVAMA